MGTCYSCSSIHSHCSVCSNSSDCLECHPPYFLDGTSCSRCEVGCLSCNSSSCFSCDLGLSLQGGVCQVCPIGCTVCSTSSVCSQCAPGNYLSGSSCLSCGSTTPGCLLCDSSQCLSCNIGGGYLLDDGSCIFCSDVFEVWH